MSEPVFSTFGCRLNACETEAMRKFAADAGVRNAIVVNTCAVTSEAVRKARREIRGLRRENPDAHLIVTGCAAQTEPETFARMEEVDAVVGNAEKRRVATWRWGAERRWKARCIATWKPSRRGRIGGACPGRGSP